MKVPKTPKDIGLESRWAKPMGQTDRNFWLLYHWMSDAYALGYRDGDHGTPYEMGCPDSEAPTPPHTNMEAHRILLQRAEKLSVEFIGGIRQGVAALRRGDITPWEEVEQELGLREIVTKL